MTSRFPERRPLPSATVYTAGQDPDERDQETPLERLRRLRLEVTELEEEVRRTEADRGSLSVRSSAPETTADAKDSTAAKSKQKREVSPAVLLQQLQLLRNDLQGIGPRVEGALEANGELASGPDASSVRGGILTRKAAATSNLLKELEAPVQGQPEASAPQSGGTESVGPAALGPTPPLSGSEVEKRVSALEAFLGANEADVDEVRSLWCFAHLTRTQCTEVWPPSDTLCCRSTPCRLRLCRLFPGSTTS